jgi:hypothetical protein
VDDRKEDLLMVVTTYACVGGPLDGREAASRFPKGFLLVDKSNGQCWLYDADADKWVLRDGYPQVWDPQRSYSAADGSDYDVRALDA